jgi:hypothetical protein
MRASMACACRSTIAKIVVSLCALCVIVSQAGAQPSKAQVNALRSACRSDYMAHCSRVNPNGPGALPCLQRNASALSPKCRAAVSAVGSAPAAAKPPARPAPQQALLSGGQAAGPQSTKTKEAALRSACRSDYMAHCSRVNPNGPGALPCPQRNAASLSAKCRTAVAAVSGGPAGAAPSPPSAVPAPVQPAALAPAPVPEANVAAVEAVSGHVVAFARGKPALLQNADIISERTQLDLKPNSELRICHYRANRLLTLRGPARASVSADGVMYEGGRTVDAAAGTCVPPDVAR